MASIRIVKTPEGEAPLWVRQAWIGCEMPLMGTATDPVGLFSRVPVQDGYCVKGGDAISALLDISPRARGWWIENLPNVYERILVFNYSACVLV